MKRIFFLALLCLPFVGKTQSNVKTDWRTDLSFLKAELPKNHFKLYSIKGEKDYFAGIEQISGKADSLSDFSIAVMLQQLIAKFGDSHTMTGWSQLADIKKILPLNLLWFEDGLFVIHTTEENQTILGSKILKINGTPLLTITDSLRTLVTEDNNAVIKKELPKLIIYIQLLEHFGFARSGTIELLLENQKGEQFTHSIKPGTMTRQNRKSFVPDAIALCYINGRSLFKDTILTADNTYYIQYNTCASREYPPQGFRGNPEQLPSFTDFRKKIMETINQNDFDKLVFDIRFNGGGNSVPGSELVRELSAVKKINQKGKLYVIIGRDTYSSAILNAMDFKNLTQAIFVGEETSGKPNHFGEIKVLQLPNSGLKIQYSTKYFKYSPSDLPTLTPDHPIGVSFKDFATGRDPVYDWIKKQ